jgi:hypothetical protein
MRPCAWCCAVFFFRSINYKKKKAQGALEGGIDSYHFVVLYTY